MRALHSLYVCHTCRLGAVAYWCPLWRVWHGPSRGGTEPEPGAALSGLLLVRFACGIIDSMCDNMFAWVAPKEMMTMSDTARTRSVDR